VKVMRYGAAAVSRIASGRSESRLKINTCSGGHAHDNTCVDVIVGLGDGGIGVDVKVVVGVALGIIFFVDVAVNTSGLFTSADALVADNRGVGAEEEALVAAGFLTLKVQLTSEYPNTIAARNNTGIQTGMICGLAVCESLLCNLIVYLKSISWTN
jgi:hypothetical protein